MNGVHDMGGMHGMGPVVPEAEGTVFHDAWEGRVHVFLRKTSWGAGELQALPLGDGLRAAGEPRRLTTASPMSMSPESRPSLPNVNPGPAI